MAVYVSKKDEAFRDYAQTAPPLKVLLSVCMPLALYQAMQAIFKILDALMASHIGAGAVSAISSLSQITNMVTAIGGGLAVGGCIHISESYGGGDYEEVKRATSTLYVGTIIASSLMALVLIPFAAPFLRILQTPEELITEGLGYFRVEIISLVLTFFNTVYIAIERSRGHSRRILVLNLIVIGIKLGLSALFVYVLNGTVIMISVATVISQLFISCFAVYTMSHDDGVFRFSIKAVSARRSTVLPIVNLSYPVAAEKMLFAAGKVIVNAMSGVYGALTVGALGISNNIGGLTTNWHSGTLDGATSLISQNRGAGRYRRTLQIFYRLLLVDVIIGLFGYTLVTLTLPGLARIFAQSKNNFDPEFASMIVDIHRYEMIGYMTLGVNSAVNALFFGFGFTKLVMVLNVARVFLFRVPVLWFLQEFTQMGAEAVGVTMMISNVATGIASALMAIPIVIKIMRMKEAVSEEV
ncbi:MAG: MATE family efflux transporter [Lachnospiraceae bacterium]|nr:MATE family efflux transporter [Lachnospiraceae bacterium]